MKEQGYCPVNLDFGWKTVVKQMKIIENRLSPPRRLAIAYAPEAVRAAFSLLLEFDMRLAALVANASEPMIGQLKLAWWRDALATEPEKRPKGEPLLGQLALLQGQDTGAAMAQLVDAWELLLVANNDAAALTDFAAARGAAIFGTYAQWVGQDADVSALGADWAVADLTGGTVRVADLTAFRDRKLRPLTILAVSVGNVTGPRLIWHALTGQ